MKITTLFVLAAISTIALLGSTTEAKCSMRPSDRPLLQKYSGYGSTRASARTRESVEDVQRKLNDLNNAYLDIDGMYGPLTEAAVKNWQRKKRLAVDGIVGPNTWASLCGGVASNNASSHLPTCRVRNYYGSEKNCYGFTRRAKFVNDAIDRCFGKGVYYCMDWTSNDPTSEHIGGNAMDCRMGPGYPYHNGGRYYTGSDKRSLDVLYEWLKENAEDLKLSNVIWYGNIWSQKYPWDRTCCGGSTSATYGHFDHLHFKVLGPFGGC